MPEPGQEATQLGPVTPQGEAMFAELQWIHSLIRSDLEVVREMAAAIGTIPYELLCRVGTRIERLYD